MENDHVLERRFHSLPQHYEHGQLAQRKYTLEGDEDAESLVKVFFVICTGSLALNDCLAPLEACKVSDEDWELY